MSLIEIVLLVGANLLLLFVLLAAPLGVRTVVRTVTIDAPPARLWAALWPLGEHAGWSGEQLAGERAGDDVRVSLSWLGRDGKPIERILALDDVSAPTRFTQRIVDDTSLDAEFWSAYREEVRIDAAGQGSRVTILRTDRYRGAALLVFRWFALRRSMLKLQHWAETGEYVPGGLFERPSTQVAMAVVSTLVLWPVFGLDAKGLLLASILTLVVAFHELGHVAAFRVSGHRHARMIFIPLLGGIAIGGRPYDSRFEVAFAAMMGAGLSAFLVPPAILASERLAAEGWIFASAGLAAFAGIAALFNLGNLMPVWKFDGGQVLRQLFAEAVPLGLAAFTLLAVLAGIGLAAGMGWPLILGVCGVVAVLSLITTQSAVKPREALKPVGAIERTMLAAGLAAAIVVHGYGVVWAAERFLH